jgi:NAD(P)-dependent dehydrogenase (short-subunit alcohol dehydrogenase family)
MSNNLTNAQVLVIGGSSGIGLATAVAAGEAGASVTIASRSKVRLDTALGSIQRTRRAVVLDTRDQSALERFFMGEGPWDHVVVSAAQTPTGPAEAGSRRCRRGDGKQVLGRLSRRTSS